MKTKLYFIVCECCWEKETSRFNFLTKFSLTEEIDWHHESVLSFDLQSYLESLLEKMNNECRPNQRIDRTPQFFHTIEEAKSAIATIKAYDNDILEAEQYHIVCSETKTVPMKILSIL